MLTPGITACIVVRNEAENLARCLTSLSGVVDEIIVIHDGDCLDDSLRIAKTHTENLYERPKAAVMEEHLVFGMEKARHIWFLRIDADEFLSASLADNLRSLTNDSSVSAYRFVWPIWDGQRYVSKIWPKKLALMRLDRVSFIGVVHYLADVAGKIRDVDYLLEHRPGYDNFTWKAFRAKWIGWARAQAASYLVPFSDVKKYNPRVDDWEAIVRVRKRLSLLFLPIDLLFVFYRTLREGEGESVGLVLKVAWFNALYRALVDWYIFCQMICRNR